MNFAPLISYSVIFLVLFSPEELLEIQSG